MADDSLLQRIAGLVPNLPTLVSIAKHTCKSRGVTDSKENTVEMIKAIVDLFASSSLEELQPFCDPPPRANPIMTRMENEANAHLRRISLLNIRIREEINRFSVLKDELEASRGQITSELNHTRVCIQSLEAEMASLQSLMRSVDAARIRVRDEYSDVAASFRSVVYADASGEAQTLEQFHEVLRGVVRDALNDTGAFDITVEADVPSRPLESYFDDSDIQEAIESAFQTDSLSAPVTSLEFATSLDTSLTPDSPPAFHTTINLD